MSLRRQSRRERRYLSAKDWPYTPEIDGYVWNHTPDAEPTGPTAEDVEWAASNLNGDSWHDDIPDHVWDELAEEADNQDRAESGCL